MRPRLAADRLLHTPPHPPHVLGPDASAETAADSPVEEAAPCVRRCEYPQSHDSVRPIVQDIVTSKKAAIAHATARRCKRGDPLSLLPWTGMEARARRYAGKRPIRGISAGSLCAASAFFSTLSAC